MDKPMDSLEELNSLPTSKLVIKNVIPAMAVMLMVLIYNVADTFFIGQTHDDFQVAAVSLATPIFLLFMALGTIFGIGGTSVISRAMGEGRKEYAKKVSSFCMWGSVLVGVITSVLLYVFMDEILMLVGASEYTWEHVKSYLTIVLFCGPFVLIANSFSNILRAEGQAMKAMMGMMIGNLLNVILDPIMILAFDWGISGAAIATVIGNIVGALYYILYFLQGRSMLSISLRHFTVFEKIGSSVLAIGVPASLATVLMSVAQIIMNSMMAEYGDMEIAAAGVAMKVLMVAGLVSIGLGQGVQPLLGFSYGAKNRDRYRSIFKFSLLLASLVSITMTGLCYLFAQQVVRAFLTDEDAFRLGVQFSFILLSTSCTFGLYYVVLNALQATGAASASLIINLSRQGLIYIPSLFILRRLLEAQGLIWAQPVADLLSLGIALSLYFGKMRNFQSGSVSDKDASEVKYINTKEGFRA